MTKNKGVGIKDVDSAVKRAIVAQAELNEAAKKQGSLEMFCCCCRSQLRGKTGGKSGIDFQNYRLKYVDRLWKYTKAELSAASKPRYLIGAVCEPCNRKYFEKGVWKGPTT